MAVVVMATTPAFFNPPMGASSSPAMSLVIAPVTKTFTMPCFLRTFVDEGNGSGIVNRRRSVRHAHDGGEPTARGSSGSGREVFLRGLAGFSEVDMQINQTGGDNFSLCVKTLHAAGAKVFADG